MKELAATRREPLRSIGSYLSKGWWLSMTRRLPRESHRVAKTFSFPQPFSELLGSGQIVDQVVREGFEETVFGDSDRFGGLSQGVFDDGSVAGLAQDHADRGTVLGVTQLGVDRREVELQLANMFREEFSAFDFHDHVTPEPGLI